MELIVLQNCALRFSVHLKKEKNYLVLRSDQLGDMSQSVKWHGNVCHLIITEEGESFVIIVVSCNSET